MMHTRGFMEIMPVKFEFWKPKFLWLIGLSPSFGKDFDDEVTTEQLTAVVDVTFMLLNNLEIP